MSTLEIDWPQAISTERLTLRPMLAGDRDAIIELLTNRDAYRHQGGESTAEQAEATVQPLYGERVGSFMVVETVTGTVCGLVTVDRRDPVRPGHRDDPDRPGQGQLELGYVLHPRHWGRGYGSEAARAVLAWVTDLVSDRHIIAVTQTANARSVAMLDRLGFVERERFMGFGAEQTLLTAELVSTNPLVERNGHLLLPSGEAPMTDDDVRKLRLANQR